MSGGSANRCVARKVCRTDAYTPTPIHVYQSCNTMTRMSWSADMANLDQPPQIA